MADDPACEKAWVWLAGVAESPEEAVAALGRALQINPTNEMTRTALDNYRAQCHVAESEPSHAEPTAPSAEAGSKRPAVLVVDDSAMVRNILGYVLEQHGYAVRTAGDATEAVSDLREHGLPDAILLEAALPRQDGYQLCKLIRQNAETARVPVVILTEQTGFVNGMRGHLAGATETFAKSLELDGLVAILSHLCSVTE